MSDSVQADLYNFADDNNLSTVGNTIDEAKAILITETKAAINWIESNQMIANPEKFHLMFLSANEKDLINQQTINIKGISLKSEVNFTLLGVDIDNHLSFHGHINNFQSPFPGIWQSFITIQVCRDSIPALAPSYKNQLTGFFVCLFFFLKVKQIN